MKKSIFIVGLIVLALGLYGCGDSGPYAKFSGTWEREDGDMISRIVYDFTDNSMTMTKIHKNASWVELEQIFFSAEGVNDSVALTTSAEETMLLEMQKDGTLRVKVYPGRHTFASLVPKDLMAAGISGRIIPSESTLLLSRPSKKHDEHFSKTPSGYVSLNGYWTTAKSDTPALQFDIKAKKLTILNEEYRNILKTDVATVVRYTESVDGIMHRAEIYLENTQARQNNNVVSMSANLALSPMEAVLIISPIEYGEVVFKSDTLLPKMSARDKDKWVAAKKKASEEKIAEEKRIVEEKAEMERQRLAAKHEARAKMPPFSFSGFTLSDSPQQVIEKALGKYEIATSFSVQQTDDAIKTINGKQNFGFIRAYSPSLDDFFSHHEAEGYLKEFYLAVPDEAIKAGLRVDCIDLEEKDSGDMAIRYYYYTLPGGNPRALYIVVGGRIVQDIPEVFKERYGDHEWVSTSRIWMSNTEAAMTRMDNSYHVFYMVSKPAYDECMKYTIDIVKKARDEEDAKRKAEEEARRSKI